MSPAAVPWRHPAAFIEAVTTSQPWAAEALCAQIGPVDLWFPDKSEPSRAAKFICARCPVSAECLAWAIEHGEQHGIWGGFTARERHRMRLIRKET